MSNITTDWIKNELYPALFENIPQVFPEHDFKPYPGGWRSKTYLDGSPHKETADKTVITKKAPGLILENGGRCLSLVDYTMERDKVELIPALNTLAKAAGLQLPQNGDFNQKDYQKYKDQASLMEVCNNYFIYCLEKAPGAEGLRTYLNSRGYSSEEIRAMELGYIPSLDKLVKYLLKEGYSQSLIDETIAIKIADTRIGSTHNLAIAYRSGSSIKGFKFRTIKEDITPKYLNSKGLERVGGFFNLSGLKGDKELVIVEGELDSLIATVRGIENVVATGGSISSEQIKDALKKGAKSFTICLDCDKAGKEATKKAIEVILAEGVNRVYIVTLPETEGGKTDPDQLIRKKGVEAFKQAIREALPYYEYQLQAIFDKYVKIEEERGLYAKDIDRFQEEVIETGLKIKDAIDRDRYKKVFLSLEAIKNLGISEESLSITVDRLTSTRAKEDQAKQLNKLLSKVNELHSKGETDKALELLGNDVKEIKTKGATGLLPSPLSFASLIDEIASIPPAYRTGYPSLDKFIGFTPGAITLIAGRPSHGKTTFMLNLLLQMSELYPDQSFYFFTYEEPVKNIAVKLLNTLTATDLSEHFKEVRDLSKPTNYEFLKHYIKAGRTDITEIEKGKRSLQELIDSRRIKIIDKNYSVEELSNLVAYLIKKERIGGVFIDYVQRMRTDRKTQDKRTEIAHISDQVLQLAKDSGLPIILGAQLNRATTTTASKKPMLENLKEAGNLEEDANTVLSVYNESREKQENSEGEEYKGMREVNLEIKALKNREGEVNQTALLTFDKWTGVIKEPKRNNPF